jgi:hypothetical protein
MHATVPTAEAFVLFGSPLIHTLITALGSAVVALAVQQIVAWHDRQRLATERLAELSRAQERETAIELDDRLHAAEQAFGPRVATAGLEAAVEELYFECQDHWMRLYLRLRNAEVRERVESIGAVLSMFLCVVELGREELDEGPVRMAVRRAVANARAAIIADSVDAELPPATFPGRAEFPRLLWMTPPGRRYGRLLARLAELHPQPTR